MMFSFAVLSAQSDGLQGDTITRKATAVSEKDQVRTQEREQARSGAGGHEQGQERAAGEVKQIRSAKPDFTKARGARPPSVERPAGKALPRGAGRPGGARGPGKR